MVGDAPQDVGKPGLRVDVVELGSADQRIDGRGAFATAVRASEQQALRPSAIPRHHRLGAGSPGLGLPPRRTLGRERTFSASISSGVVMGGIVARAAIGAELPESNCRSLSRRPADASFAPDFANQCPQAYRPAELR